MSTPASEAESQNRQKVVVVVEDNQDINDLLSLILEEEGYRVISVTNGRQAVDAALEHRPDLITLDLALPGKDGWSIVRELQEDTTTENIPILVISAYTRDLDARLRRQVARVISKPFYITQVIAEVDAILRRRAAE
jgi:two-component system, OmpR family, alkaline phosphatase synthesis response regulator PhoP